MPNYTKLSRVDFIVIHCSATRATADIGAADIDKWHRQQGWLSIGYHYVIRRDGTVEKGRPADAVGSHAKGVNARSLGICMAGGVDTKGKAEDNFTPEQKDAVLALVKQLKAKHPAAKVIGHRDVPGTRKDCPSWDVMAWAAEHGLS